MQGGEGEGRNGSGRTKLYQFLCPTESKVFTFSFWKTNKSSLLSKLGLLACCWRDTEKTIVLEAIIM